MADLDSSEHGALVVDMRDENGTAVIRLSGDLDLTSIKQARAAIDAALASHPGRVILDASDLGYMDSSGIALLVQVTRKAPEATGLYVNPNGTGAQLHGGTAPFPWGGTLAAAHRPGH